VKRSKTHYGLDAPLVPVSYGVVSFVLLLIGIIALTNGQSWGYWLLAYGLLALICVVLYLHTSLRGKYLIWKHVLADLNLPAGARILDLGCGHGAVLIMVAKHLDPAGKAVGVDIWRKVDQSGNAIQATEANLRAENVAEKVRLVTADMRSLPLENASFDFVFSSMAIHNINDVPGRARAVQEAFRVLKPGGTLIIVDIMKTREYMRTLHRLSPQTLERRNVGWIGWWTGPWMATHKIKAVKKSCN
jgi:Methylase involved in ubiquinone/menaquinone biosynthesis